MIKSKLKELPPRHQQSKLLRLLLKLKRSSLNPFRTSRIFPLKRMPLIKLQLWFRLHLKMPLPKSQRKRGSKSLVRKRKVVKYTSLR